MAAVSINKLLKTTEDVEGDIKPYFYLQIRWLDDQIRLKLQDSQTNNCYHGVITTEEMKKSADELDMPYKDYYEECRLALTTYIAMPGCSYKLEEEENADHILKIWKTQKGSIPMLFLEITLKSIRNHYDILDSAIEELHSQTKTLTDRVEKAHKFDQNSRELLEDYRLCVEEKNQLERRLLRKVAVLLNTKKQKIAELQERLSKYEEANESADNDDEDNMEENEDNIPHSSSRKRRPPPVIDSETEDEDDFLANTEPLPLPLTEAVKL